jgi:hypothetical protein
VGLLKIITMSCGSPHGPQTRLAARKASSTIYRKALLMIGISVASLAIFSPAGICSLRCNSAFIDCADDVPDNICQVFLAQAWSADWVMEEFCKETEQGQSLKEGLHGSMNEVVESLWEDTTNLQDDMAKVMALAWANKTTSAKTLQSVMSLEAFVAGHATRSCEILTGYLAPPHVDGSKMQYRNGEVTAGPCQTMADHWQHPPPRDVSDHTAPPVVVGTSTTAGSGACDQLHDSVLVKCDEASGAPVGLHSLHAMM